MTYVNGLYKISHKKVVVIIYPNKTTSVYQHSPHTSHITPEP